jgi:DUF4097 and DUF4098 domain-containing protein YvlB
MSTKVLSLATLLFVSSLVTFAQQSERQKRANQLEGAVPHAQALHVKIEGGSIRLEGYSGDRIAYQVHHSDSSNSVRATAPDVPLYKVAIYRQGSTSWLVASPQSEPISIRPIELVVRVPRELQSVALETSGGDVSVHDVGGRVEVQTGGGHVRLDSVGMVTAETGGQDIEVGTVEGDGHFRTGGGTISVRYIRGNLDAFTGGGGIFLEKGMRNAVLESGAGDIHVTFCGGELKVRNGGGNLVLGDIGGPADIRTEGGNLRLRSAKGFVRAHTTAGDIELDGIPSTDASTEVGAITAKFTDSTGQRRNSLLQTGVGDITVYLPADLPVTVRASVALRAGHRISSEIPGIHAASGEDKWAPTILEEGNVNGGGPVLEVHAGNGNITFKKLDR